MKNTNTKFLLVASVAALLSSNVNAAGTATASASDVSPSLSDAVTVSFDHPQTIAVATPTNSTGTASGTLSITLQVQLTMKLTVNLLTHSLLNKKLTQTEL
jgi:hypothetical protein